MPLFDDALELATFASRTVFPLLAELLTELLPEGMLPSEGDRALPQHLLVIAVFGMDAT
jgi:hypothetical protein